jgi:hypothetical protein
MITNDVSDYISILVSIDHIICNHPLLVYFFLHDEASKSFILINNSVTQFVYNLHILAASNSVKFLRYNHTVSQLRHVCSC